MTQRLLCDAEYTFFYDNVTSMVLESEPFMAFYKDARHPDIVRAYCVAITSIYRSWLRSGKNIPIEELIAYASDILLNGYKHADL